MQAICYPLQPPIEPGPNFNDLGIGSLREKIGSANAGDTIDFSSVLNNRTITLASVLVIDKSLTKNGTTNTGAPLNITISGNNSTRLFNVARASERTLGRRASDRVSP